MVSVSFFCLEEHAQIYHVGVPVVFKYWMKHDKAQDGSFFFTAKLLEVLGQSEVPEQVPEQVQVS